MNSPNHYIIKQNAWLIYRTSMIDALLYKQGEYRI